MFGSIFCLSCSLPLARDCSSPGIEDGLSASIMAVGRRIREEVRRFIACVWLQYPTPPQMTVIGHDQKQLQVNIQMHGWPIGFPAYNASTFTRLLQDNVLFEIDRIAARMSEQVRAHATRRDHAALTDAPFRKQYCEICI